MPNVTLSMDEKLLEQSRKYAKSHGTSLNGLIRKLLTRTVKPSSADQDSLDDFFRIADNAHYTSHGKKWKREDLYDV